ncbi:hypothetical protein HK405_014935, partial [Cladochytrium tenue]
ITPDNFTAAIANGTYDTYIKAWASDIQGFLVGEDGISGTNDDRRLYLRLAHEMNLYTYVRFWRHVYEVFAQYGFTDDQLQWVWCPNNFGQGVVADYYPGDDYVDWTCFDAYNQDGYASPADLVDPILGNISAIAPSKPLAVAEFGDVSAGNRSAFIAAFLSYLVDTGRVRLVAYFDQGSYAASNDSGFAAAVAGHALAAPGDTTTAGGRLVSDELFMGTNTSTATAGVATPVKTATASTASSTSAAAARAPWFLHAGVTAAAAPVLLVSALLLLA